MTTKAERDLLRSIAAAADPSSFDVWGALGYTPTERQAVAHACTADAVLFGGAAGPGKTRWLVCEAARAAKLYPGMTIGIFRRTYGELEESVIPELRKLGYLSALGGSWNASALVLNLDNGSTIRLRYAENVDDAIRRQGSEMQMLCFDEASLVPGEVIETLEERLRSSNPRIPVLGTRLASNPGNVGGLYLRERFVEPTEHGELTAVDKFGRTVAFVGAKAKDNIHLDENYHRQLEAISDPYRRRQMLDGSWDAIAGTAFEEWDYEATVTPPFTIPLSWRRVCAIDWGWASPFAALWGAVEPDGGRIWLYRERYGSKIAEREQAQLILDAEAESYEDGVFRTMDPSCWAQHGASPSVAIEYIISGCVVTPANNDRLAGISRLHQFLRPAPACRHHRSLGLEECPGLHVTTSCSNWLRTVPTLPRDPRRPEDVDTRTEDHLFDCTKYLLLSPIVSMAPFFLR